MTSWPRAGTEAGSAVKRVSFGISSAQKQNQHGITGIQWVVNGGEAELLLLLLVLPSAGARPQGCYPEARPMPRPQAVI
jgi:hypothetical protein